jgi:DNA polymerase
VSLLLGIDFETASKVDIKVGSWRYSLDPSTKPYCAVLGGVKADGSIHREWWDPDGSKAGNQLAMEVLQEAIRRGWAMLAHNCAFEQAIWKNVLTPRYGWPACPEKWEDTQAHAAAANLPITLEGLGAALGAPVQKDTVGHDLMMKMCRLDHLGRNRHDTPENRKRLLAYCETDVVSMLAVWQRLPKMIPAEHRLWLLDQKINARGVFIDRDFVKRMVTMAEERRHQLQDEAWVQSNGELVSALQTAAMRGWLTDQGVDLPLVKRVRVNGEVHSSTSIGRSVAAELVLDEKLSDEVRLVLENRLEASKLTSLAKLKKVEQLVDPRDGRLRNALQFCAAHTGRWSSRGLQLHNLARPRKGDTPEEKALLARAYKAALDGDYQTLMEVCNAAA